MNIAVVLNPAVDIDSALTGKISANLDGAAGSTTLGITVENVSGGALYTSTPVSYTGAGESVYVFTNGTVLTLNQDSGRFSYSRLTADITNGNIDTYKFTFTLADSQSVVSGEGSVTTTPNVTIDKFTANSAEDTDADVTGEFAATIIKDEKATISVNVISLDMQIGSAKSFQNSVNVYSWVFDNGGVFSLDAANGTWKYTRPMVDIGDFRSNVYTFNISLADGYTTKTEFCSVATTVTYPPSLASFTVDACIDSDATIKGSLAANNTGGSHVSMVVTINGRVYESELKEYAGTVEWVFSDGGRFTWNTLTKEWVYARASDTIADNREDVYLFTASISTPVGSDSASCTVTTVVPKATIPRFTAGTTMDSESSITGVLEINLPSPVKSPTLKIDITRNGTVYTSAAQALSGSVLVFTYTDRTKVTYTPSINSFTYTRDTDDINSVAADTYIFDVTVTANGQTTEASLIARTITGRRIYTYEPAYPIHYAAGSIESNNTAWPKAILELERIYRLLNENINYYEGMFQDINERIDKAGGIAGLVEERINARLNTLRDEFNGKIYDVQRWTSEQIAANKVSVGRYTEVSGLSGIAPSDGFYLVQSHNGGYGDKLTFYVNGRLVGYRSGDGSYGGSTNTTTIPVKKGDSWTCSGKDVSIMFVAIT